MSILVPPIGWNVAGGAPVYSGSLIAGTDGTGYFGYYEGVMGSIVTDPFPGNRLLALSYSPSDSGVQFYGNILSLLSGLSVYVNGVPYTAGFSGWEYVPFLNATGAVWIPATLGPKFSNGVTYTYELKP